MAYGTPTDPVAGTVITVAYAVANILDPIRTLRSNTGTGDPPAANRVAISTGVGAGSAWGQLTSDAYADGSVTDVKMANQKVNRTGDTMSGNLAFSDTLEGIVLAGASRIRDDVVGAEMQILANADKLVIYKEDASGIIGTLTMLAAAFTGALSAPSAAISGNATVGGTLGVTGAITGPGTVPLGAVVWFETAAELTAAGAAWQAYTAAAGRFLIGASAGIFGVAFVEATNYGANWTPAVGVSANNGSLGVNSGSMSASGSSGGASAVTNNINLAFGGSEQVTPDHGHTVSVSLSGSPALSGSVAIAGTGTAWLPPSRAGVYGRRI